MSRASISAPAAAPTPTLPQGGREEAQPPLVPAKDALLPPPLGEGGGGGRALTTPPSPLTTHPSLWLASALLLLALLAAWEWSARNLGLSQLVLPAPSRVLDALWRGLQTGYFWPHLRATAGALTLGVLLGCAFGFATGLAMAESRILRALFMPYVVVSQVVPKLALMPVFILWFGFGLTSTVVITALVCFFPLLETTLTSVRQVAPERLELFRMLGASRAQVLWRLRLPTGLPGILAGLRVAVMLGLVGTVVGEFMGASRGLGALVIAAQGSMDTPLMFAVLVLVAALGLVAYQSTLMLERWLLRPYRQTL